MSVSVKELAQKYYPRLWGKERIEALVAAGRLTRAEAEEIVGVSNLETGEG